MPLATGLPAPPLETLGLMEPSPATGAFSSAEWVFALPTPGYRRLAEFGLGTGGVRRGRGDPRLLHARALHPGRPPGASPAVMCVREVLVWDGRDVRGLPWRERRQLLQSLPLQGQAALKLERAVRAEGHWLYRQAYALGHETIHAHRADAPYVAGRSLAWLSIPVATATHPQSLAA